MKHLLIISAFFMGFLAPALAQKNTQKEKKKAAIENTKEKKKAQKKAAKIEKQLKAGADTKKKDGTPDMRFKENKKNAVIVKKEPRSLPPVAKKQNPEPRPNINPQPVSRTGDRVVYTDDKGRAIYEGPRGGRYYINKNGNKEYIKHN